MAVRGTAARRGPNELAGVLRDLDQRTRTVQRTSAVSARRLRARIAGIEQAPGRPGREGPAGPPGPAPLAAVLATRADGRATWTYPEPLDQPPVIVATPVDPDPGDNLTVVAALEQATTSGATVRVWRTRQLLGLGLLPLVPVGAGVQVHVAAFPAG